MMVRLRGRRRRPTLAVAVVVYAALGALIGASIARAAVETVADDFSSYGFSGSSGSQPWNGPWIESEGDGPTAGAIKVEDDARCVVDPCLVIGRHGDDDADVTRAVDLDGAISASLDLDYEIHLHGSGGGNVQLRISDDGGGSWSVLKVYTLNADAGPASDTFDILAFATDQTRIQFKLNSGTTDSHLNVDNLVITYNANGAPVVDPIGPVNADEQTLIAFTATATDPDFDNFTFSLSGEPSGATIDGVSGDFTWTPTEAQGPGSYTFDVVATDTFAQSGSTEVTITVDEVNRAPSVGGIADQTDLEGTTVSLATSATDPDLPANGLSFSASNLPPGLSIDAASGLITGTIGFGASGGSPYSVTITVSDDGSPMLADETSFTWLTPDSNRPPVLGTIGDQIVDEGSPLTFTATATDPDLDELTFSLAGSPPAGTSIDPSSGVFTWTPGELDDGTHTIAVVVTDDGSPTGSDSETLTVTVEETNSAPAIAPFADQSDPEDGPVSLGPTASDPDVPANSLSWSASGLPPGVSINPSTGVISGTVANGAAAQSPYEVTLTVSDGNGGTDTRTFTWTITIASEPPPNAAPSLTVPPAVQAEPGDVVTFQATAVDPDDDTVTFTLGPGAPTGAVISSTGAFAWATTEATPAEVYFVEVIAKDIHGASAVASVQISLIEGLSDQFLEITLVEDGLGPFSLESTGADGGLLTYAVDVPPTLGELVGGGSQWVFRPNPDAHGTDRAVFAVSNPAGGLGTATVTITISPVNDAPRATDDHLTTTWLESIEVAAPGVLANDHDPEADLLVATVLTQPASGSLQLDASGAFTYTPALSFAGVVEFTYEVADGSGATDFATVTIDITRPTTLSAEDRESIVEAIVSYSGRGDGSTMAAPSADVDRTLVVMARSTTLSVQQVGFPFLLLLVAGIAVATLGRVRLGPAFGRGPLSHGTVSFYAQDRQYGLIVPDGTADELFVHGTMLRRRDRGRLAAGDRVRFRSAPGTGRDLITKAFRDTSAWSARSSPGHSMTGSNLRHPTRVARRT